MVELEVTGKWILTGEHAVLRGGPALVFPLKERRLKLSYDPKPSPLEIHYGGSRGEDLKLLCWGVLEQGLEKLGKKSDELKGIINIDNSVPVGAGLGASASLCVAMGKLFQHLGWLTQEQLHGFCVELENMFHGESSGVDVAVVLAGHALKFVRGSSKEIPLLPTWRPQWYLFYSGSRGVTSECVNQVKKLAETAPQYARILDEDMQLSARLAEEALLADEKSFSLLAEAIQLASSCFTRWGLVSQELAQHMQILREKGAVAVKPTGSGGGGYVLSLWRDNPDPGFDYIKI